VRTWSQWTGVRPGAVQGDLVLHCGESTTVDVATSWTELQAIWGMYYHRVAQGVRYLGARFPFPLREWHSACYECFVKREMPA